MTNAHFSLCPPDLRSAVGTTDLRASRGGLIEADGCVLLLVVAGCTTCFVNLKKHALGKGCVVLFFHDETFRIEKTSSAFSVRFVALSYALAEEGILDVPSPHFWDAVYTHPVYRATPREWALLDGWWAQTAWMQAEPDALYRDAMLKTHFHSLLLAFDSRVARTTLPPLQGDAGRQWKLVTDFFKLLAGHGRHRRDVSFYADRLCITPSYLYKLCRSVLGSSPKALIDKETVSEIKSYLANTDLSVKKIAEEMHFEDSSYLCRFFRRNTGLSPAAFRRCAAGL